MLWRLTAYKQEQINLRAKDMAEQNLIYTAEMNQEINKKLTCSFTLWCHCLQNPESFNMIVWDWVSSGFQHLVLPWPNNTAWGPLFHVDTDNAYIFFGHLLSREYACENDCSYVVVEAIVELFDCHVITCKAAGLSGLCVLKRRRLSTFPLCCHFNKDSNP